MKSICFAVVATAAAVLSLAACAAVPAAPATNSPTAKPTATLAGAPNTRLYTRNDLQNILTAANAKLDADGSVDTQVGVNTDAVDALQPFLAGTTVTITPSTCADLITSDAELVSSLGSVGTISGTLTSPHLNVIVTAVSGQSLPTSLTAGFSAAQKAVLASCRNVDISQTADGQTNAVAVEFDPVAVKTNADESLAFRERFVVSGNASASSTRLTIEALDGNLLIFVSGVLADDAPTLEKAVNAVVAGARP